MATDDLAYGSEDGIASITLAGGAWSRPSPDAIGRFEQQFERARKDPGVGAICLNLLPAGAQPGAPADSARCPRLEGDKPVLVAIDGVIGGWSLALALQGDIRLASTRAGLRFDSLGEAPNDARRIVSWYLPRLMGVSQSLWWLYSGEYLSAREGHELGLLCSVVAEGELGETSRRMAAACARGSAAAGPDMRALVYDGLDRTLGEHLSARR